MVHARRYRCVGAARIMPASVGRPRRIAAIATAGFHEPTTDAAPRIRATGCDPRHHAMRQRMFRVHDVPQPNGKLIYAL